MKENHQPLKAVQFLFEIKKTVVTLKVKAVCNLAIKDKAVFRLQKVEKC